MTRGTDRTHRARRRHFPTTPLALVVVGVLAIAAGVAVPFHVFAGGLEAVATGQVALASTPFVVGLGLCGGGVVALFYGLLLLTID